MAMLSFLLLPRTFSQLPSAVCQFKVSIEVELSRLPTLSAVMECSEQSLPGPAINEESAENETGSRQIKEETVFVDVGGVMRVDMQNKIGFSRMIKNSGQAMTRDEMREDRRRRRSGEVWEEVRVKEENSETGATLGGDPVAAEGEVEEQVGPSEEGDDQDKELMLVKYNKYTWPGLIDGREDNGQLLVKLFDKVGLSQGKLRLVDQDAVTEFDYTEDLQRIVKVSNNTELKTAFKKALSYKR